MFGSQALETLIGLSAMFFIVATAASAVTEVISRLFTKRAGNLEHAINVMLSGPEPKGRGGAAPHEGQPPTRKARTPIIDAADTPMDAFKETSVWKMAQAAAGKSLILRNEVGPSYLSAKAFADAKWRVANGDIVGKDLHRFPYLEKRVQALVAEGKTELSAIKSGLESWFDETMTRAEGAYKRWATLVLFVIGLLLTVAVNASLINVARDLWQDPVTREAVTQSAANLTDGTTAAANSGDNTGTTGQLTPADLKVVADTTDKLTQVGLPVGWTGDRGFHKFMKEFPHSSWWATLVGWLATALLVMFGAPFWFDLLTRLVALRSSGTKPPLAVNDTTSATRQLMATDAAS